MDPLEPPINPPEYYYNRLDDVDYDDYYGEECEDRED